MSVYGRPHTNVQSSFPGILVSLKTRADHRLHKLKESYDHLVQRSTELQERNDKMVRPFEQIQLFNYLISL